MNEDHREQLRLMTIKYGTGPVARELLSLEIRSQHRYFDPVFSICSLVEDMIRDETFPEMAVESRRRVIDILHDIGEAPRSEQPKAA